MVDFIFRTLMNLPRNLNSEKTIHMNLRTIIGLIHIPISKIVEKIAGFSLFHDTNLATTRRIKRTHRLIQNGRDIRSIDKIRHLRRWAQIFALCCRLDPCQRFIDKVLFCRSSDNDETIAVQRPLFIIAKNSARRHAASSLTQILLAEGAGHMPR